MKICFIGGGNMASALIGGLLKRGYAPHKISVVEISEENCARIHAQFGVYATTNFQVAVQDSEVLVLAVKPQQLYEVASKLSALLSTQLLISIAAGIRAVDIARWAKSTRIARAMPNTPALVRRGVTGLFALPEVDEDQRHAAQSILTAVGSTLWVEQESMLDAVTAISGSGPAYVFYFMEAMQQAACELGLSQADAKILVQDTFLGATKLAESTTEDVSILRARVTSKNGTTERALLSMENHQVKQHIVAALHAAHQRSIEMGDELGKAI